MTKLANLYGGRIRWECVLLIGVAVFTMACDAGGQLSRSSPQHLVAVEHLDSLGVRVEELWRYSLKGTVESVGGLGVWGDGVIWIGGGRNGGVWEMNPEDGMIELLAPRRQADHDPGRTLQVARIPGGGMLLLGSNGVVRFDSRSDHGVFTQSFREQARGLSVLANGDYVVSHAPYPGYANAQYALHRFSAEGHHINSWHPLFRHNDWRIVGEFSGGPLAVTDEDDLLFGDATRFQITKYLRGTPDSSYVVVEDGNIVPPSAIEEAILPDGWLTRWTRLFFVDEIEDDYILSVVREVSREGRGGLVQILWVIVDPSGEIIARSRYDEDYWYVSRGRGPGRYVVIDSNGLAELSVSVESINTSGQIEAPKD